MTSRLLLPGLAALALSLAAAPAAALSMSISRSTAGSSQDVPDNTGPDRYAGWGSNTLDGGGLAVPDAVGNSRNATVRYNASVAGNDEFAIGDDANIQADLVFTTTISVTADATTVYDLTLDTSWLGVLAVDGEPGSAGADLVISNALATLSCSPGTCNELNQLTLSGDSAHGVNPGIEGFLQEFGEVESYTISGLAGDQTITLVYTFTMDLDPGLEDAAILLGRQPDTCSLAGNNACYGDANFEGLTDRLKADDGLFVTATASITAVPEPNTMLLLGIGLLGLTAIGRRRR